MSIKEMTHSVRESLEMDSNRFLAWGLFIREVYQIVKKKRKEKITFDLTIKKRALFLNKINKYLNMNDMEAKIDQYII